MIVLDTHIWVWWVHDAPELPTNYRVEIERHEPDGLGVSAISCWVGCIGLLCLVLGPVIVFENSRI